MRLPDESSIQVSAPLANRPMASYTPGAVQQAQEQGGQALSNFGGDISKVASTTQDNVDQQDTAQAQTNFMSGKIDLDQKYANDPDPATAPQRYFADMQKLAQTTGANIANDNLRKRFVASATNHAEGGMQQLASRFVHGP